MRTFISVEIPEEATKKFIPVNNLLRNSTLSLKLVKLENLHLTLKFLGEISEERLKEVAEGTRIVRENFPPFSLSLKGVGIFPSVERPRVIWVGIEEGKEELKKISKVLDEELAKRGFPSEKREFQCHLTLARVKRLGAGKEALKDLIKKFKEHQFSSFWVNRLNIMKSELKKEGPIYTALEEIALRKL